MIASSFLIVLQRDKAAFTAGLTFIVFTEWVFLKELAWVKAWYTVTVLFLYVLRYIVRLLARNFDYRNCPVLLWVKAL